MEVLLKTATIIKPSTKTFDLSKDINTPPAPVTLVDIHTMPEYSKVTVSVKVLSKGDPVKLDSGKTKQEVITADSSGTIIVTLWEEKNRSPRSFKIVQAYSIYGSRIQHDEESLAL